MEERFEIATPLGDVWMWGRDTGQPIALLITGAFAAPGVYTRLQLVLPGFDVLRTHLPGNHSPPLMTTSIGAMAAALTQAMARRFPKRPLLIVGLSTGALVAMATRAANLKALVLIEPFLRTRHIWLFPQMVETFVEPQQQEFLWKVLGVRQGESEERDYRHLVASLTVPGAVMLGTEPLQPPRLLPSMPSLVDEEDRRTLRAQPLLRVTEFANSGHNVAADNSGAFINLLAPVARYVQPGAEVRWN